MEEPPKPSAGAGAALRGFVPPPALCGFLPLLALVCDVSVRRWRRRRRAGRARHAPLRDERRCRAGRRHGPGRDARHGRHGRHGPMDGMDHGSGG